MSICISRSLACLAQVGLSASQRRLGALNWASSNTLGWQDAGIGETGVCFSFRPVDMLSSVLPNCSSDVDSVCAFVSLGCVFSLVH